FLEYFSRILFFFYFCLYGAPSHLPSFPSRRSSDLGSFCDPLVRARSQLWIASPSPLRVGFIMPHKEADPFLVHDLLKLLFRGACQAAFTLQIGLYFICRNFIRIHFHGCPDPLLIEFFCGRGAHSSPSQKCSFCFVEAEI